MRKPIFLFALILPASALAHEGYPTADRVEWVIACMQQYDKGGYELVHKCSCAIDTIAKKMKYEDYVESSTAARGQSMRGEGGNEFRDPKGMKDLSDKYKKALGEAKQQCLLK